MPPGPVEGTPKVEQLGAIPRCSGTGSTLNFETGKTKMIRTILVVLLIIILIGALPSWPYSAGWGYYPSGGIGTLLVIIIVLALMGII